MSELTSLVFPPQSYVDRLNACPDRAGMPRLTIAHPLAMLLYSQSLEAGRWPPLKLISITAN
jgi:hypothetical protein